MFLFVAEVLDFLLTAGQATTGKFEQKTNCISTGMHAAGQLANLWLSRVVCEVALW